MKKLFRFSMACSVFFMLAVFMSSCRQDLTVNPSVNSVNQATIEKVVDLTIEGMEVKDGMLHFADYDAMSKAQKTLNDANWASYKAFCQRINFKSLAILQDDFSQKMELVKTEEDIVPLKQAFQDIINFTEESAELRNPNRHLLKILARNSMFKVNKALYRFDEKGEIIALDGDINNMNQAILDRRATSTVSVFKASQITSRAACGWGNDSGWQVAPSNSKRRGKVAANLLYNFFDDDGNGNTFRVKTVILFESRAEKKVLGIWFDYATNNNLNIKYAVINVPYQGPTGSTRKFYNNKTITTTNSQSASFSEVLQDYPFPISEFSWVVVPSIESVDIFYTNQGGVDIHYECF